MASIRSAACTDVGRVRQHNEDNYFVDPDAGLYIVADGMGGHAAGEVASAMAIDIVRRHLERGAADVKGAGDPQADRAAENAVRAAIAAACADIFAQGRASSRQRGMGTTLSMLWLRGLRATIGHVGDSRIYRLRRGVVEQITEDHSLVNELLRQGKIKAPEELARRFKNAITRAVGVHREVEPFVETLEVLPDDRFLLCTDGLHEYLDDQAIRTALSASDLDAAARSLVERANRGGGKDNITCVLIVVEDVAEETDEVRATTAQLDALRRLYVLRHLAWSELAAVLRACSVRHVEAGELVCSAQGALDGLHVVLTGAVDVMVGERAIATLEQGAHFGEAALTGAPECPADLVAREETELLVLGREAFERLVADLPRVGLKLWWAVADALAVRVNRLASAARPRCADGDDTARETVLTALRPGAVELDAADDRPLHSAIEQLPEAIEALVVPFGGGNAQPARRPAATHSLESST